MAKIRTDKKHRRYVSHADVVGQELKDPKVRAAYAERRMVHEIARAVRSMRESAGLSQEQLADLVNMKQPAIARLETSQGSIPRWQTLNRIALALHQQLKLNLGDIDPTVELVKVRPARSKRGGDPVEPASSTRKAM